MIKASFVTELRSFYIHAMCFFFIELYQRVEKTSLNVFVTACLINVA